MNSKKWIAPSESVETIEQGTLKAATYAETYLRQVANRAPGIEVEGISRSVGRTIFGEPSNWPSPDTREIVRAMK